MSFPANAIPTITGSAPSTSSAASGIGPGAQVSFGRPIPTLDFLNPPSRMPNYAAYLVGAAVAFGVVLLLGRAK